MGNDGLHGFSYVDTPVGIPFADEAAMTIPKVTTFPTWRSGNGGTAVIADMANGLGVRMTAYVPAGLSSPSLTYAAVPVVVGSEGWQATARMRGHFGPQDGGFRGIIMRDAVSGQSVLFEWAALGFMYSHFWDDDTDGASDPMMEWPDQDWWIRVKDDLTYWYCYVSPNGNFWQQIYRVARNDYLGTTPTHVGIFMNPNYDRIYQYWLAGYAVASDCYSWLFEML